MTFEIDSKVRIGPFVCEWCGTPFQSGYGLADMSDALTPQGKRKLRCLGTCAKCRTVTWSVPVLADIPEAKDDD